MLNLITLEFDNACSCLQIFTFHSEGAFGKYFREIIRGVNDREDNKIIFGPDILVFVCGLCQKQPAKYFYRLRNISEFDKNL